MDKAQFEREIQYGAAAAIAKRLLRRELITQEEYNTLTDVLTRKYRPMVSSPRMIDGAPTPKAMDGNTKSERRIQTVTQQ